MGQNVSYENNAAFVLRCHKNSPELENWILTQKFDAICFDETNGPCTMNLPGVQIVRMTESLMKKMHKYHNTMWYSLEAQFVHCSEQLKGCPRYIWFIEYDVYTRGSIKHMLQKYNVSNTADFICSDKFTRLEKPDWYWWSEPLAYADNTNVRPALPYIGCFLPICRISSGAIETLKHNAINKIGGFCEQLIPSVLTQAGHSIALLDAADSGIIRWRPEIVRSDIHDAKLYHPVYDLSTHTDVSCTRNAVSSPQITYIHTHLAPMFSGRHT